MRFTYPYKTRGCVLAYVPTFLSQDNSFCFHPGVPSHSTSSLSRQLQVKAQKNEALRQLGVFSPLCKDLLVRFISHSQKYTASPGPGQDLHIGVKHCHLHICCGEIQRSTFSKPRGLTCGVPPPLSTTVSVQW